MANQSNYPEEITTLINQRPARINAVDERFIKVGQKNVLFGTSERDVVELWIYNPDGTFANFTTLPYYDPTIGLSTVLDAGLVNGTPVENVYEFLNLNLKDIANRIGIDPGRYSFVANFFVNEVGSEDSYQLYLKEVSDDRTEVKLSAVYPDENIIADIKDFATPSVPRLDAQALIDQSFDEALDGTGVAGDAIELEPLKRELDELYQQFAINFAGKIYDPTPMDDLVPSLQDRLDNSDTNEAFRIMFNQVMPLALEYSTDALVEDSLNFRVQRSELVGYVRAGVSKAIEQMKAAGLIDNRFKLV